MLINLKHYAQLMRLDKPIGTFLLLWPTLWGLWLASDGWPNSKILFIFIAGTFLMRSAGCVMNDFADRKVDGRVSRTKSRPLATGAVRSWQALVLVAVLAFCAFLLVLMCNQLTILLAFIGAALAVIYPFMKRFTNLPQLGLSVAFTWGVPMGFAAVTGAVDAKAWFVFVASAIWPIIYDTMYAMADRQDDLRIGVKSTAILFASWDLTILAVMQVIFILLMGIVGFLFQLHTIYYICLGGAALLLIYHQYLIKNREPVNCFYAFKHNNWVGLMIFLGVMLSYLS